MVKWNVSISEHTEGNHMTAYELQGGNLTVMS